MTDVIHPPAEQAAARAADQTLKTRHAALWASGDYPTIAGEVIPSLGPVLVEAAAIKPGDRVLDVAAGAGNAAIPAAELGARVTAADLTPELVDTGRRLAAERGVTVDWQVADAEALPFGDREFDVVLSCVGVMFAPHHQITADELVRVTKPGGTVAVLNWTPAGFVGRMFATMKPFAPPPSPGAQAGPLWGNEHHVRSLLGPQVTDLRFQRRTLLVDRFRSAEAFRDLFKQCYGPTVAAYAYNVADPARVTALDDALVDLGRAAGADSGRMEWEYLLVTATKAA